MFLHELLCYCCCSVLLPRETLSDPLLLLLLLLLHISHKPKDSTNPPTPPLKSCKRRRQTTASQKAEKNRGGVKIGTICPKSAPKAGTGNKSAVNNGITFGREMHNTYFPDAHTLVSQRNV